MGGVSPVGAGAHRLRLPAASSCWLLLHQLTPLELRPDAHTVFTHAQIIRKKKNRHLLVAKFKMSRETHSLLSWRPSELQV